ncbi:SDR family NAD(P)-dependent oxidoreductase, partial [Paraburkholderia sp.]
MRALVTGGSGVIGQAICDALAAAGHEVWVHANRQLAQAEAVAQRIVAAGGQAHAIAFDVTDADATEAALAPLIDDANGGPVQILVNNAGITADAPMAGMS